MRGKWGEAAKHAEHVEMYGLSESQLHELATYNSEKERGILHSQSWHDKMAQFQFAYDQAARKRMNALVSNG